MNIKSLLLGSAAALAAVSGAQAADAIIAAEPEPMEYVRVCDAFGTGFFYIPGTETCLRIGGEVRAAVNWGLVDDDSDWESAVRVRLAIDARNDTEFGALTSYIQLQAETFGDESVDDYGSDIAADARGDDIGDDFEMRQAYIELAGFRAGRTLNWWDDDIAGEADALNTTSIFNSVRYTFTNDAFVAGISVDDAQYLGEDALGISGVVQASLGAANLQVVGGYDFDSEEGAVRGIVTADIGPGSLGLAGVWASGENVYFAEGDWTVAVSYAVKATEKLTITPAASYIDGVGFTDVDAWRATLTGEYEVVDGLNIAANIGYTELSDGDDDADAWDGFVRLIRTF